MRNKQVPSASSESVKNIVFDVLARSFARNEIATPRIMTESGKGISNNSGEFTAD